MLLPLVLQAQAAPPPEPQDPAPDPPWEFDPPPVDPQVIEGRRRPDYSDPLPDPVEQDNPGAVRAPPPSAFPVEESPIPDRWRLIESLGLTAQAGYAERVSLAEEKLTPLSEVAGDTAPYFSMILIYKGEERWHPALAKTLGSGA